jgi:hypothetical protein
LAGLWAFGIGPQVRDVGTVAAPNSQTNGVSAAQKLLRLQK